MLSNTNKTYLYYKLRQIYKHMRNLKIIILLFIPFFFASLRAQTFNFYFGNIHAHSSYSDGNKDSSISGLTKPLQAFNYAKTAQNIDFYGISEHNHLSAGMLNPIYYHKGLADADSANIDGTFVALYGMEWGVISGGGHVLIYGYDSLIGWDVNDYDVYVAQGDYSSLWKKINEKQSAFAYLAHPSTTDYNNLYSSPYDLSADNAIIGLAARSGPALSTNTTYSGGSSSNYIARYNDALKKGYHVGVGLDHDTHNSVFGKQTAGRMVVLAPSLTRLDILSAIKKMRFYSSDDWNTKVNFSINNQPMGSIITNTGSPTILVSVTDADAENVSSIVIYRGIPGSGTAPSILTTLSNTANVSYAATVANNVSYYYYLKITQSDGDIIWTSPIWYTRNDALTNNPPIANFSTSTQTVCAGQPITFTDNTTNGPDNWNWNLTGASPNTSTNQSFSATYYTGGTYTVTMNASNLFGTSNTVSKIITVKSLPLLVVNSPTICLGETDTLRVTGASSYTWSTGENTSTIDVSPTVTYYYFITGALNGCVNYTNTAVVVEACVGIDELSKTPIKLYPNPANHILTIDYKHLIGEKTIELYDVSGKCVLTKISNETLLNLDISSFPNGMYLLNTKFYNNQYVMRKFIIQRK